MMINNEMQKLVTAVDNITEDLWDEGTDETPFSLIIHYATYTSVVEFNGIPIWGSEWDDREWDETTQDYKDFEPFLRKEIMKVVDIAKRVSV